MSRRILLVVLMSVGGLTLLSGCGRRIPSIVPVQGIVLLNGKPLPKARVTFLPQLDNMREEFNSTAVADENGRFTLTCGYKEQPGAVIGNHIVVVTDPPLPADLRNSRDTQEILNYRAKLGNRPIPEQYSSVSKSPLKVEIKEGQPEVKLELTR